MRETTVAWHPDGDIVMVGTIADDVYAGSILKLHPPSR